MENNNEQINLENKVMGEIKSGKVKLRSRYLFLAEKFSLGSVLIFSVLLAVLFISLFFFYLKTTDNLWYLSFGSRGWFAFLESFPYIFVAVFVILILAAGFIIKKTNWLYKVSFGKLTVAMLGVMVLIGLGLAFSNIWEFTERHSFDKGGPGSFFRPLFEPGLGERGSGIAGVVGALQDNLIILKTPHGEVKLNLERASERPPVIELEDFVMAIGQRRGAEFMVDKIRVIDREAMPMIRRGIERNFPPPDLGQ